jgi:hypothetical protein
MTPRVRPANGMSSLAPCVLAGLVLATTGTAQTVLFEVSGDSPRDRFGSALAAVDVDLDGFDDLVIGAPWDDAAGLNAGRVVIVSGQDGSVLREWFGAAPGDAFGAAVAVLGDIDGDLRPDILVGVPGVDQFGLASGLAEVRSGRTGAVLRSHAPSPWEAEFASRLGAVGDLDGDGVGDYAVGTLWLWDELGLAEIPFNGEARLFSGASGAALPATPFNGGRELQALGDADGDGVNEFLLVREQFDWSNTQAVLASGTGGALIDSTTAGSGSVCAGPVGDMDGDGLPEHAFAWGAWGADEQLQVRSLVSGVLHDLVQPASVHGNATSLDGRADLNGDGVPDLLCGYAAAAPNGANSGRVVIRSGIDFHELVSLDGAQSLGELGDRVVTLGDLDGDGCAEWAVSEPFGGAFNPGVPGVVRVYSGGALGFVDHGGSLTGVAGEPQLSGTGSLKDGSPFGLDLAAAAPSAPVAFVLGLSELSAPFKGGVLGPSPDLIVFGLLSDASGGLQLAAPWPVLAPATTLWFQFWIEDAVGPFGWAASNTLSATNAP